MPALVAALIPLLLLPLPVSAAAEARSGAAGAARSGAFATAGFSAAGAARSGADATAGFGAAATARSGGFATAGFSAAAEGRFSAAAARYRWPVAPPHLLRRFEPPPERWLPGHRGVDLGSVPGAAVRAAGDGVVVYAQTLAGRGVISILHAGGLRTTYEPVTATVRAGDRVTAGRPIGALEAGHPGCPVNACLHWGLRRGDVYLDPLALLGLGRVRLLPLG